MDGKLGTWLETILTQLIAWINKLFEFFGLYTSKYAGWIVAAVVLWIVTKMLNIKLKLGR